MSALVRVSAVSYLNTAPFVYGLQQHPFNSSIQLSLDYPAECARKLIANEVDLGLVPVAALLSLGDYHIVSDYCLGTLGMVRSVALFSNCPLDKVTSVVLDYQSRTSNLLVKILARDFWKKNFEWILPSATPTPDDLEKNQAMVAIGDKVFAFENLFSYNYDLSVEWHKFTYMPFVFAVWAANKSLPESFINLFNGALLHGLNNIDESISYFPNSFLSHNDARNYLTHNISYSLDDAKRKALDKFLLLAKSLEPG